MIGRRVRNDNARINQTFLFDKVGGDYADDSYTNEIPVFFDRNGNAITVKDLGNGCCSAIKTKCEVITKEGGELKKCIVKPSNKKLCKRKCRELKQFAIEKARKQKKAAMEKEAREKEKIKSMKQRKEKYSEEVLKKEIDLPNSSSDEFMDEDEDEYYDEVDNSNSKNEKSYGKMKNMNDITKPELEQIVKEINSPNAKADPNPKCKKKASKFRYSSNNIILLNHKDNKEDFSIIH